ncbi:MAG: biotin transporter BioY [Magnetovibrionaceae bacterium]
MTTANAYLVDTVWTQSADASAVKKLTRGFLIAFAGSLLIWLSAKVQIPFYPVPMTMQVFAVLGLAMALGPKLGFATIALYLAQGAMGLPVFAGTPEKGIGLAYMMQGTGGYLVGYLMAGAALGWLAARGWDRNAFTAFGAMLIGVALIYIPGLLWLGALFGWDKPILAWGFTPFILGDLIKVALAACLLPYAWKLLGRKKAD